MGDPPPRDVNAEAFALLREALHGVELELPKFSPAKAAALGVAVNLVALAFLESKDANPWIPFVRATNALHDFVAKEIAKRSPEELRRGDLIEQLPREPPAAPARKAARR